MSSADEDIIIVENTKKIILLLTLDTDEIYKNTLDLTYNAYISVL